MTIIAAAIAAASVGTAVKSWKNLDTELNNLEARVDRLNSQVRLSAMREEIAVAEASGIKPPFHPSAVGANHFAIRILPILNHE